MKGEPENTLQKGEDRETSYRGQNLLPLESDGFRKLHAKTLFEPLTFRLHVPYLNWQFLFYGK